MLKTLTRLLFPAHCASCGEEGDWLCANCRKAEPVTAEDRCRLCGKRRVATHGLCSTCRRSTHLDGVVSLFHSAQPAITGLVRMTKHRGHADAIKFLTTSYRTSLLRALPEADWSFSFVPLDRARFSSRGFNQAEIVARVLAGKDSRILHLFKKVLATRDQDTLPASARRTNLKKAFKLTSKPPTHLVICDDTIVTGTTLDQLASLAKKRGAKRVWAVTVIHG